MCETTLTQTNDREIEKKFVPLAISDENIEGKSTVNFSTRGISSDDLHNLNIISTI